MLSYKLLIWAGPKLILNAERLRPKVQPLTLSTLFYTILAEKVPLLYTFYWKKGTLSHAYSTLGSLVFIFM